MDFDVGIHTMDLLLKFGIAGIILIIIAGLLIDNKNDVKRKVLRTISIFSGLFLTAEITVGVILFLSFI